MRGSIFRGGLDSSAFPMPNAASHCLGHRRRRGLPPVPGNIGLSERHRLARVREIFQPYHDRIATKLDRRREAARPTALISVHSFTPVFNTVARLWHVGVLYNRDQRFAQILMELLHREEGLVVGDNEPYSIT